MNTNTVTQIIVATVATVAAGVILDKIRQQKPTAPPVAESSKWWEFS